MRTHRHKHSNSGRNKYTRTHTQRHTHTVTVTEKLSQAVLLNMIPYLHTIRIRIHQIYYQHDLNLLPQQSPTTSAISCELHYMSRLSRTQESHTLTISDVNTPAPALIARRILLARGTWRTAPRYCPQQMWCQHRTSFLLMKSLACPESGHWALWTRSDSEHAAVSNVVVATYYSTDNCRADAGKEQCVNLPILARAAVAAVEPWRHPRVLNEASEITKPYSKRRVSSWGRETSLVDLEVSSNRDVIRWAI